MDMIGERYPAVVVIDRKPSQTIRVMDQVLQVNFLNIPFCCPKSPLYVCLSWACTSETSAFRRQMLTWSITKELESAEHWLFVLFQDFFVPSWLRSPCQFDRTLFFSSQFELYTDDTQVALEQAMEEVNTQRGASSFIFISEKMRKIGKIRN